jgi:DNA adenine methylase
MGTFWSPLRYPGGKQRLAPFISEILSENQIDGNYVEAFAGGAGIAINLLLSKKIKHIHLNDSDIGVYAFWHSIVNHGEEFCRSILKASLTIEEWKRRKQILKQSDHKDLFELGFSFFYLNRCNRSGVINGGVIGGLNQTGKYKIDARFQRNDLIRRIEAISQYKENISLYNLDAKDFINQEISRLPSNTLIYFDPPYFYKSNELYMSHYKKRDHIELAEIIQNSVLHKWLLSYDKVPEIMELYKYRRQIIYELQYNAARIYKGNEIFVFSDALNIPLESSLSNINSVINGIPAIQNLP